MVENKIIDVFKSSGMTRVEFAEKLNISNAVLSHLASGRNKASLDLVVAILTYFPKISADWLLLDNGEMYRSQVDVLKIKQDLGKHIAKIKETSQLMVNYTEGLEKEVNELK